MKSLVKFITLTTISISTLFITSCHHKEEVIQAKDPNKFNGFKALLDYIHSQKAAMSYEQITSFQLRWEKSTNMVFLQSMEEKEPEAFPIPLNMDAGHKGSAYQLDCCCNEEGLEIWKDNCNGSWSCGALLEECLGKSQLNQWEFELIYIPKYDSFVVKHSIQGD